MTSFIFVGPDPKSLYKSHPGGQVTAAKGLMEYANAHNYSFKILDTTQSSFPLPSTILRLERGIKRIIHLSQLLKTKKYKSLLLFCGAGFSFYERAVMCLLCKINKVPSVLFIRDGHFKNFIKNPLHRFVTKHTLRLPTYICAQGEIWQKLYKTLDVPDSKIKIIRNWLPNTYYEPPYAKTVSANETIHFLFIGWLVKEKGILELLKAAETLAKTKVFKLTLVGNGHLYDQIKYEKKNSSILDYLNITGWLDTKAVQKYMQKSHVFVLPSKAEGFPNALLEALSQGMPAICTNVGAIADSVIDNKNGFLLEASRADLIYRKMKTYIDAPHLIERHSKESIMIFQKNHNKEKNCEIVFDLLQQKHNV